MGGLHGQRQALTAPSQASGSILFICENKHCLVGRLANHGFTGPESRVPLDYTAACPY